MKKIVIVALILLAVITLSFLKRQDHSGSIQEVSTYVVEKRTLESTVLATGVLTYGDERSIRSEVTAMVEEVWISEGDLVEKDQILVSLDQENFQLELDTQRAAVALRKIEIERSKLQLDSVKAQLLRLQTLADQDLAQVSSLEDAQDQIKLAEVNLKAQAQLLKQSEYGLQQTSDLMDKTIIRSPMNGLVSALDIKEGEMAITGGSGGLPLLTLVDPSEIFTEVGVDEADIGRVSEGQQAMVYAIAYPNDGIKGVVRTIATSARNVPGKSALVFPVEVTVFPPENIILRPGMSTRAEIKSIGDEDILAVPIEAVREGTQTKTSRESNYSVFVHVDGKAIEKTVTIGDQDDRFVSVESGITAGEEVISGPYAVLRILKTNTPIKIVNQDDNNEPD